MLPKKQLTMSNSHHKSKYTFQAVSYDQRYGCSELP